MSLSPLSVRSLCSLSHLSQDVGSWPSGSSRRSAEGMHGRCRQARQQAGFGGGFTSCPCARRGRGRCPTCARRTQPARTPSSPGSRRGVPRPPWGELPAVAGGETADGGVPSGLLGRLVTPDSGYQGAMRNKHNVGFQSDRGCCLHGEFGQRTPGTQRPPLSRLREVGVGLLDALCSDRFRCL